MRQFKGYLYFIGECAHHFIIFTKNLCAHSIGFAYKVFVGIHPFDEIFDVWDKFNFEGVITDIDRCFHFLFLLVRCKTNEKIKAVIAAGNPEG
jgi:hypothetical protein